MSPADSGAAGPPYAELHCISNFTFLRGASHPEELVDRAVELGYSALAITDECSVAGIVRAHVAARKHGLKLIVGSEFVFSGLPDDRNHGLRLVMLAKNRNGYAQLCELITAMRRAAVKGSYAHEREVLADRNLDDCLFLWPVHAASTEVDALWLKDLFGGRIWIARSVLLEPGDVAVALRAESLAELAGMPQVATGQVHMHLRQRRALQDVLTAVRLKTTLDKAGTALYPNSERYLRGRSRIAQLFAPELIQASVHIAGQIDFSLDQLSYQYPREVVPAEHSATSYLRVITEAGIKERWPEGETRKVRKLIEHELQLIHELNYEPYFLTVFDIVKFARSRGILCQGRGSAANSAVCYALGITEVDPARMSMLMERFISKERHEPPDIDVDFENSRREEVIQYIYDKYGRNRAALTATVTTYRPRGAIRDVGRVFGLSGTQIDRMARSMQWWDGRQINEERVKEAGFDPDSPLVKRLIALADSLLGFPRHLSQHVGGFLVSEQPLSELVPVENAAMPDRTVIQWDKDDLDALGLLKVDVLALGMLSALTRGFDLLSAYYNQRFAMDTVPAEDSAVYDMVSRGETTGVFQIESRAQMAMLPRLKPRCFYDLVIEVAIVRPGPIQGDMVHPYLRRRNGEEPVVYPGEAVRGVLERTLGVPIFQEQVMQLAIVAAGFTPGEADQLRRSMAAWRRHGTVSKFEEKLVNGMTSRGYAREFAEQVYQQIKGFGEYGFPESHAASFALIVYVSAWMKCHHPAAFTCALLNSMPMGFYAPSQLVQSAQRQGVEVLPVDVNSSDWDCTLEKGTQPRLRLGLRMAKGLSEEAGRGVEACRGQAVFIDMQDFAERVQLTRKDYSALAAADAFLTLAGNRHQAYWQVTGIERSLPLTGAHQVAEAAPLLRMPEEAENVYADYRSLGLSLRSHPLALLREQLQQRRALTFSELEALPADALVHAAGLVITRQRPGTANNVTFVTLEDETGTLNLIIWEAVAEAQRQTLLRSRLLGVTGRLQKQDGVMHLIANRLFDYSALLGDFLTKSRDFH